ncbi:MAG: dTDP-4-dehydrorhamnose reductase [Lachnospiraceae bacterium]|nr:dTDP-4-dehydrorhamnose reductase [Lachnospiraceae bacterium]MCI7328229.1 dTDP-4-dehydrorhamnose reductase [Lachnospiraceae bacterium]MDY3301338.1 dTDP-4-dehydrorhamnose reductase [Lachnospiraceae bacterium]
MKKILLTGCNGQLGRAIQKEYGDTVEFLRTDFIDAEGITRLDISDIDQVMNFARAEKPDAIINCAAFTNVDGCETNEDAAFKANAIGPRNLAIASRETGAKLIHVSTDYVFEGNGTRPYVESDTPNPVSAYGRTKLAGEQFVRDFADRYFILRTAWLYGDGKNFVKTMLGAAQSRDEVSVVCDQKGSPTSAVELAKMIHFLEPTENYGIFHATCEGDTNWAEFTEEIYRKAGLSTKVNHLTSEEYAAMNPAAANRPKYSILENRMLKLTTDKFMMADWHDALDYYLQNMPG